MDAALAKADFKNLFKKDNVLHDNVLFKLHHQVNFFVILVGVVFIFGENYLNGKAITCVGGDSYSAQFCWLHGTGHLPTNLAADIKEPCDNGDKEGGDREMHYYIWLPFVLVICLLLVKFPRLFWKSVVERGMMEGLTSEDLPPEKIVAKILKADGNKVKFSKLKIYHIGFVFCEILNIAMLLICFYILDSLLNGKYFSYGVDVNDWSLNKAKYQANKGLGKVNPMCSLFPTEVGCTVHTGGVAGGTDKADILCILSNNLFNQFYFLIVWCWWVLLLSVSCLGLVYRMAQMTVGGVSRGVLRNYLAPSGSDEALDDFPQGSLSPELCFLLGRLALNMKGSRMADVMTELAWNKKEEKKKKGKVEDNDITMVDMESGDQPLVEKELA